LKKWQDLTINALMNLRIALIAGGILKLVLDYTSIVSSIIVICAGCYLLFVSSLVTRNIELKG